MATKTAVQESWADDVDDNNATDANVEIKQSDGTIKFIEYSTNEDGKKVKITRHIKRTLQKSVVNHAVAERQKWAKFGAEKGNKPGPDKATTTVGENVSLRLSAGNKNNDVDANAEENAKKEALKKASGVTCRLCKGGHFTAKCPYKDSLSGLEGADTGAGLDDDLPPMGESSGPGASLGSSAGAAGGSKYVPPSMRAGARGPGEAMTRPGGGTSRDDLPTLRVTNISEDTEESDLRELFGGFGRVARVYVGRDRETGAGKGFAFVSFEDRASAQKAIDKVHGKGYDNLILSVQWSQPRPENK